MNPYELRRQDFSLDDDHEAVRDAFAGFFAKECPTGVVRAAEPLGHDPALWTKLAGMGAASMALPESVGGDGSRHCRTEPGRRGDGPHPGPGAAA